MKNKTYDNFQLNNKIKTNQNFYIRNCDEFLYQSPRERKERKNPENPSKHQRKTRA